MRHNAADAFGKNAGEEESPRQGDSSDPVIVASQPPILRLQTTTIATNRIIPAAIRDHAISGEGENTRLRNPVTMKRVQSTIPLKQLLGIVSP